MGKRLIYTEIARSAAKHKTKNGKVIVSQVAMDVFGNDRSSTRRKVRAALDGLKITRIVKPRIAAQPKVQTQPEQVQTQEDLKVELFLAIKAKSGSEKAFELLQQLV